MGLGWKEEEEGGQIETATILLPAVDELRDSEREDRIYLPDIWLVNIDSPLGQ